jgi:hypothetical protein
LLKLNTWVQIIGIAIAAGWGAYTSNYKEMMLPRAAPVIVTVDLQLQKIDRPNSQHQGENKALVAVEMTVSATNPSSRQVYLFPSVWLAYGLKVDALRKNHEFAKQATSSLNKRGLSQIETHAMTYMGSRAPIAIGKLIPDSILIKAEREGNAKAPLATAWAYMKRERIFTSDGRGHLAGRLM